MKHENTGSRRMRVIAAVCAMIVLAGSGAGIYAFRSSSSAKAATEEKIASASLAASRGSDIISAGGTITSSQLSDSLGLKDTAAQLKVGEVLVESGDTVTVGTPLYQLSSDSLAKAKKTLQTELQSAKSELLEQKLSYQTDKNEAYLLCESELLLGETAQAEYESNMSGLESKLKKAYDSYHDALDTIKDTPAEITSKQSELDSQQAHADSLQEQQTALQEKADKASAAYDSAAEEYNSVAAEYNAAAGVVRYLGNALGKDTSDIELAQKKTAEKKQQLNSLPADKEPEHGEMDIDMGDAAFNGSDVKLDKFMSAFDSFESSGNAAVYALYDSACEEYDSMREKLSQAENDLNNAENEYKTLSDSLTECSSELKEAQSSVSALSKEISSLESALSKAKSELSKLRSEYNSLNASYKTDQIELKNKLDTDTAAYENAEYHYEITLSTLDDELAKVQEAYDTAEENLKIFEESLSDGYISAAQDGIIYSLNCQEGRSVNVNAPYVYYVDESGFSVTVELDQNDITQVSIGDTVVIYSSETGIANGKITAIAAGESKSLADVRFNVTITADEDAELYNGESVNVYFNYSNMKSGDFADFKGDSSSGGEGRSFGGGMPEGFDPSNMPGFSGRKED